MDTCNTQREKMLSLLIFLPSLLAHPFSVPCLCRFPWFIFYFQLYFGRCLVCSYHSLYFHSTVSGTKAGFKFSTHDVASPPFCPIQQHPGLLLVTLALPVLSPSPFPRGGSHFWPCPFVILTKNFLQPVVLGSLLCSCLTNCWVLFCSVSWLHH